ncbi:alpha-galactosidase [Candidatus Poribacteria bacterium]|nr:alpha-galactosidase [Candidatus Poribacteria bacterium]
MTTLGALTLSILATGKMAQGSDWLVTPVTQPVRLSEDSARHEIALENGLIRRTFRLTPNAATIEYRNLITDANALRGVKPEAILTVDGTRIEVGGLKGQPDYAYLDPAWLDDMTAADDALRFVGYETGEPEPRYPWTPKRHAPTTAWPPAGKRLTLRFKKPGNLTVLVHYEMYVGLPVLSKWITVENAGTERLRIDGLEAEVLAVTEGEKPRLHVESDFAFAGMDTTAWGPDLEYTSQTDYLYQSPILLTSRYPLGPGVVLEPGERFDSFRTFELLYDSDDRERRGLARRRLYRTLAPQVTENPILMHVRSSDSEAVRLAIDQCAEVGFEMLILTFWSGFDIESEDPEYIARFRADVDYAHSKGIEIGGYTLMCASRDVGAADNCISPETGKPGSKFGQSVCLGSAWVDGYVDRVLRFMDATGVDVIETDGPYHGDVCASATHAHHASLDDSQVAQWQACVAFYHACRERGIYINSPDWYYLAGSNKCGMGYRETNFSLPRWRQIHIARQNIFDGTYEKSPSMGWMFVPLVEYHGGGAAATFEPLSEHLLEYEWHLAQNFGSGVQACYRGPRLFDTDATKAVVGKWVDFYKRYRAILDSDIIHVRRADGADIDCMMHVNPSLPERALAMVYNPTDTEIATSLEFSLYYAGLSETARIREREGESVEYSLDRQYRVTVPVKVPEKGITWFVVE